MVCFMLNIFIGWIPQILIVQFLNTVSDIYAKESLRTCQSSMEEQS